MFTVPERIKSTLITMGCTENPQGKLTVGEESPETKAFLLNAIRRFPDGIPLYSIYTEEEMRFITEGIVRQCGLKNPRLDKDILKEVGDIFVLQCGCNPEGKRTPLEGNETPFIEGRFRSIEAGSELPGSSLIPFDRLRR